MSASTADDRRSCRRPSRPRRRCGRSRRSRCRGQIVHRVAGMLVDAARRRGCRRPLRCRRRRRATRRAARGARPGRRGSAPRTRRTRGWRGRTRRPDPRSRSTRTARRRTTGTRSPSSRRPSRSRAGATGPRAPPRRTSDPAMTAKRGDQPGVGVVVARDDERDGAAASATAKAAATPNRRTLIGGSRKQRRDGGARQLGLRDEPPGAARLDQRPEVGGVPAGDEHDRRRVEVAAFADRRRSRSCPAAARRAARCPGGADRSIASPVDPSSASPTIANPSASRIARAEARKLGWSSTMRTVGGTRAIVADERVSRSTGKPHSRFATQMQEIQARRCAIAKTKRRALRIARRRQVKSARFCGILPR